MITSSAPPPNKTRPPVKSSVLRPQSVKHTPKAPPTAPPPKAAAAGTDLEIEPSERQTAGAHDMNPPLEVIPPTAPPAAQAPSNHQPPKVRRPSRADIVAPAKRSYTLAPTSKAASARLTSPDGTPQDGLGNPPSSGAAGGPRSRSLADLGEDESLAERAAAVTARDAVSAASALGATSASALRAQLLEGAQAAHKALTKRQHLLRELLTSEHQFVMWMRVFQETFGVAIERQEAPWARQLMADKAASILLNTHKNILEWNGRLLHSLQELLNDTYIPGSASEQQSMVTHPPNLPQPFACVGQLVVQHAELFGLYGSYADMHESSASMVDRLVLQTDEASSALAAVAAQPTCRGQDMRSLLIMPVQRIPRYRMLLLETTKCTERAAAAMRAVAAARETLLLTAGDTVEKASTAIAAQELQASLDASATSDTRRNVLLLPRETFAAQHALLEQEAEVDLPTALHQTDRAAKHMNSAIARRLARQALKDLEGQFVGGLPLVSPRRRLIREGRMLKVCRRFDKTYYWHLFSDALLYSEETRTGSAAFKVHRIMSLAETWVEPIAPEHNSAMYAPPHALRVLNRSKSFIVAAETAGDKAAWLRDLSATIIRAHTEVVNSRLGGSKDSAPTSRSELFAHSTADTDHSTSSSAGAGVEKLTLAAAKGVSEYTATVRASAAPVFIPDHVQPCCSCCNAVFSVVFCPRHHCRLCGCLVCAACSKTRLVLPHVDAKTAQRICDKCQQNSVAGDSSTIKLQVTVVGGRDLPSSDRNGHSDPYVRLFHGGIQCGETPVVKKTLNPSWDPHTATFEVPLRYLSKGTMGSSVSSRDTDASSGSFAESATSERGSADATSDPLAGSGITNEGGSLVLECWDRDMFSSDDFLGRVSVKVQRVLRRLVATRRSQQRAARAAARELAASGKKRAATLSSRGDGKGRPKQGAVAVPRLHTDFALSLLGIPDADAGVMLKLPLSELGPSVSLRASPDHDGRRSGSTVAFDPSSRAPSALPRLQLAVKISMPDETSTAEENPLRLIRQWAVAAVPLLPSGDAGVASSTPPPLNDTAASITELMFYYFIDLWRIKALVQLRAGSAGPGGLKLSDAVEALLSGAGPAVLLAADQSIAATSAPTHPKREKRRSILQSVQERLPSWLGGAEDDFMQSSTTTAVGITSPATAAAPRSVVRQPDAAAAAHVSRPSRSSLPGAGVRHVFDWWDSGMDAQDAQEWADLPSPPPPPLAPPLSHGDLAKGLFPSRRRRSTANFSSPFLGPDSTGSPSSGAMAGGTQQAKPRPKRMSFFDFVAGRSVDRQGNVTILSGPGETGVRSKPSTASRGVRFAQDAPPANTTGGGLPPARKPIASAGPGASFRGLEDVMGLDSSSEDEGGEGGVSPSPDSDSPKDVVDAVVQSLGGGAFGVEPSSSLTPTAQSTGIRKSRSNRAQSHSDVAPLLRRTGTAPRSMFGAAFAAASRPSADEGLPDLPAVLLLKSLYEELISFQVALKHRREAVLLWEQAQAAAAKRRLARSLQVLVSAAGRTLVGAAGIGGDRLSMRVMPPGVGGAAGAEDKELESLLLASAEQQWDYVALQAATGAFGGVRASTLPAASGSPTVQLSGWVASIIPLHPVLAPSHRFSRSQALFQLSLRLAHVVHRRLLGQTITPAAVRPVSGAAPARTGTVFQGSHGSGAIQSGAGTPTDRQSRTRRMSISQNTGLLKLEPLHSEALPFGLFTPPSALAQWKSRSDIAQRLLDSQAKFVAEVALLIAAYVEPLEQLALGLMPNAFVAAARQAAAQAQFLRLARGGALSSRAGSPVREEDGTVGSFATSEASGWPRSRASSLSARLSTGEELPASPTARASRERFSQGLQADLSASLSPSSQHRALEEADDAGDLIDVDLAVGGEQFALQSYGDGASATTGSSGSAELMGILDKLRKTVCSAEARAAADAQELAVVLHGIRQLLTAATKLWRTIDSSLGRAMDESIVQCGRFMAQEVVFATSDRAFGRDVTTALNCVQEGVADSLARDPPQTPPQEQAGEAEGSTDEHRSSCFMQVLLGPVPLTTAAGDASPQFNQLKRLAETLPAGVNKLRVRQLKGTLQHLHRAACMQYGAGGIESLAAREAAISAVTGTSPADRRRGSLSGRPRHTGTSTNSSGDYSSSQSTSDAGLGALPSSGAKPAVPDLFGMLSELMGTAQEQARLCSLLAVCTPESHGDWGSLQSASRTAQMAADAAAAALAVLRPKDELQHEAAPSVLAARQAPQVSTSAEQ